MCYTGGPRCKDATIRSLHFTRERKQILEAKLDAIEQRIAMKRGGKDIRYGRLTMDELKSRKKELTRKHALEAEREKNLQEQILLSETGIEMLRKNSEDPNRSVEERMSARVAMENAISERKKRIFRAQGNRIINERVDEQMRQDGISQERIDECLVDAGMNLYPRTPKEYKARIARADKNLKELADRRRKDFDEATTDERRLAVREHYGKLIARQKLNKYEAERGYYSSSSGLQELLDTANDKSLPLKERYRAQFKHESHKKLHDSIQNDVRLRTRRRERIITAYKEIGADPRPALSALRLKDISVSEDGRVRADRLKTVTGVILFTQSEYERVDADFKAKDSHRTIGQYAKSLALESPEKKFTQKPLGILNAEAERFSDGQAHRQRTVQAEERTRRIDFSMTVMERDILKKRAGSFNNSLSSYGRFLVTGMDPRQIQNDRSQQNNETKAVLMEAMTKVHSKSKTVA